MSPDNDNNEGARKSRASGAFFGRRKGKPLRPNQERLMAESLGALKLDLTSPPPTTLSDLFDFEVESIRLEIGFGGGEHLIHRAATNPET
ncbi:MAG: tRNA ((46)-N7)-methyltransferase TrmB, partial [Rhizobium sp.]|nr:tRNA ((46)-N7)-methyltransferase TrmB [Rhizobium sp.]